jgi:ABC-type arginine transport system permease subunit
MYAIVCIYVDSLYTIFIHSFPSLVSKLLIFFFVSDHLLLVAKEFVKS